MDIKGLRLILAVNDEATLTAAAEQLNVSRQAVGKMLQSLEREFGTRLFETGAEAKEGSTILGHSTGAMTYNTYIHDIESHKANITGLLDDLRKRLRLLHPLR